MDSGEIVKFQFTDVYEATCIALASDVIKRVEEEWASHVHPTPLSISADTMAYQVNVGTRIIQDPAVYALIRAGLEKRGFSGVHIDIDIYAKADTPTTINYYLKKVEHASE